ncbi:hypothetical protein [Streptomyces coeruleofuscus]|uniref:Uncharacterized protein n=1 Tax=Streptomyces coeruleofuscus TaxID=66879 RepID=A0ABP5VH50_9ACTN
MAADSSELGQGAFARICAAEAISPLIRDPAAGAVTVRGLEEAGLRGVTV